jgi:prepilin-type processing-associated H-X9-DG protein
MTSITDGTSNTIMVGERPPASDLSWGWWAFSDFDNLLALPNKVDYIGSCAGSLPGRFRPDIPSNPCAVVHYWSMHPGGGNWLLADGSVRFISYANAAVLEKMASIDGGEVITLQ